MNKPVYIVTKIDAEKPGRNPKWKFRRVYCKDEQGSLFLLDIVPQFRNFKRWEPFLQVGKKFTGARKLGSMKLDADSKPVEHKDDEEQATLF